MVAIPKIVGLMSCGVLLCLGLSANAVSAADQMKTGHAGDRIGGQAGRGYEQGKQQHIVATQAGERIGGQSGRGYEQGKQQHKVATHVGERIGGQAGLDETEGMGK